MSHSLFARLCKYRRRQIKKSCLMPSVTPTSTTFMRHEMIDNEVVYLLVIHDLS